MSSTPRPPVKNPLKKLIPFEKADDEKVVIMGLFSKNFIEISDGTRIYSLSPGKTTLFIVTKKDNLVVSQKYEPEYAEG